MTDHSVLAAELRTRIDLMAADLAERIDPLADSAMQRREGVRGQWTAAYGAAFGDSAAEPGIGEWFGARVREAAAAWVFGTAVVRFCEDNRLVQLLWIAGPGERLMQALTAQQEYFRAHPPTHTDREYLGTAIAYFTRMAATRTLFGRGSAIRLVSPSVSGARGLLEFWREAGENGDLLRDLVDPSRDPGLLPRLYESAVGSAPAGAARTLGVVPVADMLAQFAAVIDRLHAEGVATLEQLIDEASRDGARDVIQARLVEIGSSAVDFADNQTRAIDTRHSSGPSSR